MDKRMLERINFKLVAVLTVLQFMSCATSMTPLQFVETLPTLTNTKFIPSSNDDSDANKVNCTVLKPNRVYNAPIGLSVKHDLKNGAKGIDEWVKLDGGNAYSLVNYEWVTVDDFGSTQLKIEFATMKCLLND